MTAKCPYFGSCGGCSAQHIPYEVQTKNKVAQLARNIGLQEDEIELFTENPYEYRNRMDFIFSYDGLGFRKKGDWKTTVKIESCAISDEKINSALNELQQFFYKTNKIKPFDLEKQTGVFKYAVVRVTSTSTTVIITLNKDDPKLGEGTDLVEEFAKQTEIDNILITYVSKKQDMSIGEETITVKGSDELKETYLGNEFFYSAFGFFQNNHTMAEVMHDFTQKRVQTYKEDTKDATLIDLYGGVGTFGINNAQQFNNVLSVESFAPCTQTALKNAKHNNITNFEAETLDAKRLKKLNLGGKLYFIVDPPRSGMHQKTVEEIIYKRPKVIFYISCNINQLRKDIPKFKKYDVKKAALFDLFPQTPHCEGYVELVLKEEFNEIL